MKPILKLIIAIMLILCLADMPYGFYELVRFAAAGTFVYLSYDYFKNKRDGLQYLEKLEGIVSEDDHLIRQFILRSKTAFGYLDGEDIRPYTFDEKEKIGRFAKV